MTNLTTLDIKAALDNFKEILTLDHVDKVNRGEQILYHNGKVCIGICLDQVEIVDLPDTE